MSTTFKPLYGTSNQSITITLDALANNGQRCCLVVDNSTNLFEDALVGLKIVAPASGTSATGAVNVYAYGTADGGTTYGDTATGTDAGVTLTSPPNLRLIGTVNVVANSTTYNGSLLSVATAFDGVLPQKWGVVVENKTGGTLGAGNAAWYQGYNGQGV